MGFTTIISIKQDAMERTLRQRRCGTDKLQMRRNSEK